jgi:hypothetical protein
VPAGTNLAALNQYDSTHKTKLGVVEIKTNKAFVLE